jgi:hypothetical protein
MLFSNTQNVFPAVKDSTRLKIIFVRYFKKYACGQRNERKTCKNNYQCKDFRVEGEEFVQRLPNTQVHGLINYIW